MELVVYRVAQEGLTNAIRHADAARADVMLSRNGSGLRLEMRDDGRGIDGAQLGNGLRGMRERAFLVSGHLTATSLPGGGTRILLEVPL